MVLQGLQRMDTSTWTVCIIVVYALFLSSGRGSTGATEDGYLYMDGVYHRCLRFIFLGTMKEAVMNRSGGKRRGEARPKENPPPVVATLVATHLKPKPKTKTKPKPKPADTYATTNCADGYPALLNDDYCDYPSDWRDEPSTSVCSHTTVQTDTFQCADGNGAVFG